MAGRRRSLGGERRIDAAIDHFLLMGFRRADIRTTVNELLKLYGGKEAWVLLEDSDYNVVLEKLLEKQQEEERQQQEREQEERLRLEQLQQEEEEQEVEDWQEPMQLEQEEEEEEEGQETMQLEQEEEDDCTEAELAVDEEDTMHTEPTVEALPHPETSRTRPPCFGWLSESDSEEEPPCSASLQHEVPVPSPGEGSFCKRKRYSRWDVKTEAT